MTLKVTESKLKFAVAGFIFSLLVSMSLMELLGGVLLLIFIVKLVTRKLDFAEAFPIKSLNIALLVWMTVVSIGFALNLRDGMPWFHRIAEFRWYLYLFAVLFALQEVRWDGTLPKWLLVNVAVICSYGLLTFVLQRDLISGETEYAGVFRIGGPFANPMVYAQSLNFFAAFFWGYLLSDFRKYSRQKFFMICLVLLSCNILLTYTRGVWIALFLAIVLASFLVHLKLGLKVFASVLLAASMVFIFVKPIRERVMMSLDPSKSYDSERLVLWKTNFKIFQENPIFGLGYGENKRILRSYYDQLGIPAGQFEGHAHNQYLHFMAGTGLSGLMLYLFFLFYFLYQSFKSFQRAYNPTIRACSLGLIVAQVSFIIAGLTESNFEHARVKFVLIFVWAAVIYFKRFLNHKESKKSVS